MVFFSHPHRTPRLSWLLPAGRMQDDRLARLAATGMSIALPDGVAVPDQLQLLQALHMDAARQHLAAEGEAPRTLLPRSLPSQVAQRLTARDHAGAPGAAIVLDIVLGETTEAAWAQTERLIEGGLAAHSAASALIGTAQEIAMRIEDYRRLGVTDIVLDAPPDRAPYDAVSRDLLPLLSYAPAQGSARASDQASDLAAPIARRPHLAPRAALRA